MAHSPKRPGKTVAASRPVESLIHVIRGQKVMLDADLARLYGVETKQLHRVVKRNLPKFPEDRMFQLTEREIAILTSRIVAVAKRKIKPHTLAFTDYGVIALSFVLNSKRAIQTSLDIVRAFIRQRQLVISHNDIAARVASLERCRDRTASVIGILAEDIARLGDV